MENGYYGLSFKNLHACGGYHVPPPSIDTGYWPYSSTI